MVLSLERRAKELNLTLKVMIHKRGRVLWPGFCFVLFYPKDSHSCSTEDGPRMGQITDTETDRCEGFGHCLSWIKT